MRMVVPINILGLPSCAVPVGSDGGLPQAVQLIGWRFREGLLLDAAQAIEDRAPVLTPIGSGSAGLGMVKRLAAPSNSSREAARWRCETHRRTLTKDLP
jgi:hypothetical protein